MTGNKKRPTGAATPDRAGKDKGRVASNDVSRSQNSTDCERVQGLVLNHILPRGRENAVTGRELVGLLRLRSIRELTQLIERERRAGAPICASNDTALPGYYIAADERELAAYISSLDRRVKNIRLTRQYLKTTLKRMGG